MIKDIQELNFPSYATMCAATCPQPDMGEWVITSQIRIDGEIAPDFSYDWEVVFQGHKYIQPLRKPQGSKDNEKFSSVINLTFQHWAIWQLKRFPFVTMQPIDSGTAVADEEVADVSLNLGDFSELFKQVLAYYYGDKITLQLNPEWQYKEEAEVISISHTKVWNVLIEVFHKQFGVRWAIEPNGSYDKYVIKVGYPTTEQSHIFEYGFEGGLLKTERQPQSEEICNILKGRGGEKNLPSRYFKNTDPNNPDFAPDPDWIEELANIYFSRLMPATFRSYVQGWKAAHISKYPGYTAKGEANAYSPWAYRKGFTDTKFHPVEFVADEIVLSSEGGARRVEILPGYSPFVKKGSSLDKYGPLLNTLDDDDEIFPTIQGIVVNPYGRIDQTVAVEPITSDDIAESAESDAQITTFRQPWPEITEKVAKNSRKTIVLTGDWFSVPTGKTANFDEGGKSVVLTKDTLRIWYDFKTGKWYIGKGEVAVGYDNVVIKETSVVLESATGGVVSASGIPSGVYRYKVTCKVYNTATEDYNVTVSLENPKLTDATLDDKWSNVWHIWVKNIWQTSKQTGETDKQYADRVWRPILGDREGNEAKILFTSGALAISDDYEFTIVATPEYDTSKTLDGVQSHWKITLAKSDADLESLGVYLPSTKRQAAAGDYIVFMGIDPQFYYTDWAERRVDDNKKDVLGDKKDIKPTWVVQTDRVRLNGEGKPNALIRQLHPGDTLRLADKRFIEGDYETLYLSSLTYTYREPTKEDAALNPDVEIVLSDRYEVSANVVSTLQGEVSALAKQVGSISNIEQIMRAVGDKLYLRKDGMPDRSMSPTEFASLLTSLGFRSGMVGGAGWGIYKDANGNWVIEADRFMARQDLEVNNLIINQVLGKGGTEVDCAAFMEITRVEELDNGYKCYFDQHEGTVANLFHVDDVAWNNRYTPENADLKFYRRRITEVGADYVVLTKPLDGDDRPASWTDSGVNGVGIPAEGDVIVHRGNYTDKNRQYIKVRDVVGGGYERYIEGLDSVTAEGVEYYFVGRQIGDTPRWFVGYRDIDEETGEDNGSYIEYKDREFNLHNVVLSVGSRIGDFKLGDIIQSFDASKYLRDALPQSTSIINGLVLTSAMLLGYENQVGERVTMAGHSGLYNNPKSIASFWGGPMVDKFYDEDGSLRDTPLATNYAKAMMRMDGSAYFGGGAHAFNADGTGWLGDKDNGIKFDNLGRIIVGSGVTININDENKGLKESIESVLNFQLGFENLLTPCDVNGDPISWAQATQSDGAGGIKAKSLKASVGLWSESFVSAKGLNPFDNSGVVGASALADLTDVLLSNPTSGQALVYNGTHWVNQTISQGLDESALATYLTDNNYAKKSDIPSLDGYATELWVEGKGYITASALTPYLTSQDAANTYLTQTAFSTFKNGYDTWKADVDDFMTMFAKESDGDGGYRIKALFGLYTDQYLSARGNNPDASDTPVGLDWDAIEEQLTANGYAKQSWVEGKGYITSSALSPYALNADLTAHTNNTTIHITAAERTLWNQTATNLSAILGSDSDTIINKWEEVVAFLDTYTEADTLANLLSNKVSKSGDTMTGTLTINNGGLFLAGNRIQPHASGGGFEFWVGSDPQVIIENKQIYPWSGVASLGTATHKWTIGYFTALSATNISANKITIGDCEITWDADKGGLKFSTGIYSDEWVSAKGANPSAGGGSVGIDETQLAEYLAANGYATQQWVTNKGYVTLATVNSACDGVQSWVNQQGFLKSVAWSDVTGKPAWIGATKPSYAFSELTSHPTTLAGYGITDAKIAGGVITLGGNTITPITSLAGYATTSWVEGKGYLTGITKAQVEAVLTGNITSHTHSYLPLSGGTLTGVLTLKGEQYYGNYALNMSNSNIVGLNAIFTSDLANDATEGIQFKRSNGNYDSIWASDGIMYFSPNGNNASQNGSYATNNVVLHSANIGSYAITSHQSLANYVTLNTAQTISGAKRFDAMINAYAGFQSVGDSASFSKLPFVLFHIPNINWGKLVLNTDGVFHLMNGSATEITSNHCSLIAASFVKSGGTSSQFLKADGSVDSNSYALSSALGNYLPLTGGTMTGLLKFNTGTHGYVFADSTYGIYMQYDNDYINVHNGNLYWKNSYTFWHSGNDGSGSGLDADLLDGVHNGSLTAKLLKYKTFDNASELDFDAFAWSANGACSDISTFGYKSGLTIGNGLYRGWQIFSGRGNNHIYYRNAKEDRTGWSDEIKTVAFTSDNVASATRLQGSYSLWGQTFYGNNVSGNMTGVGSITASGIIKSTDIIFGYKYSSNNNAAAFVFDKPGSYYTGIGSKGETDTIRFGACDTNGNWVDHAQKWYFHGSVGVGCSPSYTLDVNGDIRSNTYVRCPVLRTSTGIEMFHSTPYIDFHYNNTDADYDVRLINDAAGTLKCIGTFRATVGMWSDGYVSAKGQNTSSDIRLKHNLTPFAMALHQIAYAPSVEFDWREGSHDVGSIAQYWQDVNPLLTPKGPDGYLTLQYGKTALLASITIAKKVMSHEERIAELERENKELKRKIEILERR